MPENIEPFSKVSFLIPTLNSANVLEHCLSSIKMQKYPHELIEIIVADGGSTDGTLQIAQKYGAIIMQNPLKSAEAGKVVALKKASGTFIALVDSDNILPDDTWLQNMLNPLKAHPEIIGAEPISYIWRNTDGFITRYCALTGVNDPLVFFLGNYDRMNLLTDDWTDIKHTEVDHQSYIIAQFSKQSGLPTLGANGTIFRTNFLREHVLGDYLFDIDILAQVLLTEGKLSFIKVKCGIVHTYCESSILKFVMKQRRRIRDYLYFKKIKSRTFPWTKLSVYKYLKFIIFCITVIPLLIQSASGYVKKRDFAWFFHLLACELTLFEYAIGVLLNFWSDSMYNRSNWKQ